MKIDFLKEPKVRDWKKTLQNNGVEFESIKPAHLFHKKNGELLFGTFEIDAKDSGGRSLPKMVLIRGHACVVVPLLINKDTGEKRYLMIRQMRNANGCMSLEFPAGMVDRRIADPTAVARDELHEETGLMISKNKLFRLRKTLIYSSPGLQDEGIYFYGCVIKMSDKIFKSFKGRIAGKATEGEYIKVVLCTRKKAQIETTSLQVMLGFRLFEEYLNKIGGVSSKLDAFPIKSLIYRR